MFNNNKYYIMSEMLYDELTQVSGFTKLNGYTYQEHIILQLKSRGINNEQLFEKIILAEDGKLALKILHDEGIMFTHTYYD